MTASITVVKLFNEGYEVRGMCGIFSEITISFSEQFASKKEKELQDKFRNNEPVNIMGKRYCIISLNRSFGHTDQYGVTVEVFLREVAK